MLDKKITELINKQINMELYSAYLYLEIVNYYSDKSLNGFANWMEVQVKEEEDHANLFRAYLLNNDDQVELYAIDNPTTKFKDFGAPLTAGLEHEKLVTASINTIYQRALELHDYRTTQFLDWFIKEQGEEEKNFSDLITRYNLYGGDAKGLYMLDQELGARVYNPPSLVIA